MLTLCHGVSATTSAVFSAGETAVKYRLDNARGLLIAAAYPRVLPLAHVDDLLDAVASRFVAMFKDALPTTSQGYAPVSPEQLALYRSFTSVYDRLLDAAERGR